MTRRDPDLLSIIVDRYPGEMVLVQAPAGWKLIIESPALGMHVTAHALGRDRLGEYAAHWERFRLTFLHGPQRCACGELYSRHAWDATGKHRGECPDRVGRYQPAVLTPATEVSDA